MDDALGVEVLQGADRLAVVAELAVVVVLQDPAAGAPSPVDDGRAPLGMQGHAERELVRGREEHGPRAAAGGAQVGRAGAVRVDRERRGAQPGPGQDVPVDVEAVLVHRDRAHTALPQGGAEQ